MRNVHIRFSNSKNLLTILGMGSKLKRLVLYFIIIIFQLNLNKF